jgi:hypothetical protein
VLDAALVSYLHLVALVSIPPAVADPDRGHDGGDDAQTSEIVSRRERVPPPDEPGP